MPFDLILQSTDNYQDFARIARLGRMYRLIKMTRLLRILKIVKDRSKVMKYLNDFLKIGLGFERLFFFIIIFIILAHIVSCIMVITAQLGADEREDGTLDYSRTWMNKIPEFDKLSPWGLYITACYNTIQTITTVGYGDLTAGTTLERGITVIIMMIGVISFSFATGSLSSIL